MEYFQNVLRGLLKSHMAWEGEHNIVIQIKRDYQKGFVDIFVTNADKVLHRPKHTLVTT